MNGLAAGPVLRRLGGATLCALLGLLWVAGPVAAQSVVFGTPSATSKFGQSISFSQPYGGATIASADILIEEPGDVGPTELPLTTIGASTLDVLPGHVGRSPVSEHAGRGPLRGDAGRRHDPGRAGHQRSPTSTTAMPGRRWPARYVRLHWFQSSNSFAQQMLTWADDGVQKAAAFFGVTETQPIDFFVYPSESAFQQGLSQAETIGGVALSNIRTCFAAVAPGDSAYGQSVLPHEVTHIVFADASDNPYHSPPRWLNEGLARLPVPGLRRRRPAAGLPGGPRRDPPTALRVCTTSSRWTASRIYLAYAESVSAVDFMVRKYGQPAVAKLVRAYANGVTDDEAFVAGMGIDVAAFNSAWMAANGVKPIKVRPAAGSHGAAAARLERLGFGCRARRHTAADRRAGRRGDARTDLDPNSAAPRPGRGRNRLRRGRGHRAARTDAPRRRRLAGDAAGRQGARMSLAGARPSRPGLRRGCDDHLRL